MNVEQNLLVLMKGHTLHIWGRSPLQRFWFNCQIGRINNGGGIGIITWTNCCIDLSDTLVGLTVCADAVGNNDNMLLICRPGPVKAAIIRLNRTLKAVLKR